MKPNMLCRPIRHFGIRRIRKRNPLAKRMLNDSAMFEKRKCWEPSRSQEERGFEAFATRRKRGGEHSVYLLSGSRKFGGHEDRAFQLLTSKERNEGEPQNIEIPRWRIV